MGSAGSCKKREGNWAIRDQSREAKDTRYELIEDIMKAECVRFPSIKQLARIICGNQAKNGQKTVPIWSGLSPIIQSEIGQDKKNHIILVLMNHNKSWL